ncbi:hypothetical protein H1R20_g13262, partial [Candolleomyces eurysporus]
MRIYTGVIAILIESALPLSLFGIISAILQQITVTTDGYLVCWALFSGLFYSFCALAPHMIIFRVTTGRSFTKFPTVKDGVISKPLEFAHQTAESCFLQSNFDPEFSQNRDSNPDQGNASVSNPRVEAERIVHITQERRGSNRDVEKVE